MTGKCIAEFLVIKHTFHLLLAGPSTVSSKMRGPNFNKFGENIGCKNFSIYTAFRNEWSVVENPGQVLHFPRHPLLLKLG